MGGKAFPDTDRIPSLHYGLVVNQIIELLPLHLIENLEIVGSGRLALHKVFGDGYNDLDVAVECNDSDWDKTRELFEERGYQTRVITPRCISVRLPFGSCFHQIDFLQTKRLDDAILIYWKDEYSVYKSAHKNILLTAMLNVLTTKEWTFGQVQFRVKQHYDFYDGLIYMVQKRNFGVQRYTLLDRVVINDDSYISVVKSFLPEIKQHELRSFEQLYCAMASIFDSKTMYSISCECGDILKSCKLEIPKEILWTGKFG